MALEFLFALAGAVVDGLYDATEALRLTAGVWQKGGGDPVSAGAVGPWRALTQQLACLLLLGSLYEASGALEDAAHAFKEGWGLVRRMLTCCAPCGMQGVSPERHTSLACRRIYDWIIVLGFTSSRK